MSKKGIVRLTHFLNFRDLVVGLGILVTILLLYGMRESFASVFVINNFFGMFFSN